MPIPQNDRIITQIIPGITTGANIMRAQYSNKEIITNMAVLLWVTYQDTQQAIHIAGIVNTPTGLDYADVLPGFTGYSF